MMTRVGAITRFTMLVATIFPCIPAIALRTTAATAILNLKSTAATVVQSNR